MRTQLEQYVELLFAGAKDCEDIKQEILQNTLDRYDDLIAEGKVPEAAYRLAITGIGDVNEILGVSQASKTEQRGSVSPSVQTDDDTPLKKVLRAVSIGLYILCPLPLIVLSQFGMDILGLCGLLTMVAVATVMIILAAKKEADDEDDARKENLTPRQELKQSIDKLIGTIALVAFFVISIITGAWFITWLIFPISGAVKGLVHAILDLKEAKDYEN